MKHAEPQAPKAPFVPTAKGAKQWESTRLYRACCRNLRAVADQARSAEITEGLLWYTRANRLAQGLADRFGLTLEQAAGILAVMSPGVAWDTQVERTGAWIEAELAAPGSATFAGYTTNVNKARQLLVKGTLGVIKGPKVTAFWRAIAGNTEALALDRHALRAALGTYGPDGDLRNSMTAGQRRTVEKAYRHCAKGYGLAPREFQAIVWCAQRRLTLEPSL